MPKRRPPLRPGPPRYGHPGASWAVLLAILALALLGVLFTVGLYLWVS